LIPVGVPFIFEYVATIMFNETPKEWSEGRRLPGQPGVYAIFLKDISSFPREWQKIIDTEDNILYIGRSDTSLSRQLTQHFEGSDSTEDPFRRTIGAVLREHQQLKPILRPSATTKNQYSFKNENVLSAWIQQHCLFAYQEVDKTETATIEKSQILERTPLLNIQNNPIKKHEVAHARTKCWQVVQRDTGKPQVIGMKEVSGMFELSTNYKIAIFLAIIGLCLVFYLIIVSQT
jgi:hypothetical protein